MYLARTNLLRHLKVEIEKYLYLCMEYGHSNIFTQKISNNLERTFCTNFLKISPILSLAMVQQNRLIVKVDSKIDLSVRFEIIEFFFFLMKNRFLSLTFFVAKQCFPLSNQIIILVFLKRSHIE